MESDCLPVVALTARPNSVLRRQQTGIGTASASERSGDVVGTHAGAGLALAAVAALILGFAVRVGGRTVFPADFLLVALVVRWRFRPSMPKSPAALAIATLFVAWVVALVTHPSAYGTISTIRWFALIALVPALQRAIRAKPTLTANVLGCAAVVEALIVVGQSMRGRALGLGFLGEPAHPFIESQQVLLAPTGTINHPDLHGWFLLTIAAVLIVLSLRRRASLVPAAIVCFLGASAATVSYKRMPMLAWSVLGAALAVHALRSTGRERRTATMFTLLLLLGVAVFLPSTFSGWHYRADAGSASVNDFSSGRVDLLPQAARIIRDNPVGVGPNNYLPELIRRHPDVRRPTLVHVVPLLATAEGGWAVGAALAALVVAGARGAWRSRRTRRWTPFAIAAAPLLIVSMLTPLPMLYAIGPVLTALGLATCAVALDRPESPTTEPHRAC